MMKSCSTMKAVFLLLIMNRLMTCAKHLGSKEVNAAQIASSRKTGFSIVMHEPAGQTLTVREQSEEAPSLQRCAARSPGRLKARQ